MGQIDDISLTLGKLLEGQDDLKQNITTLRHEVNNINNSLKKSENEITNIQKIIIDNTKRIQTIENKPTYMNGSVKFERKLIIKMLAFIGTIIAVFSAS